jgi:D-arabinose 1-dehydrogenase-like Zn-dependent alcohol dehydrogenase
MRAAYYETFEGSVPSKICPTRPCRKDGVVIKVEATGCV